MRAVTAVWLACLGAAVVAGRQPLPHAAAGPDHVTWDIHRMLRNFQDTEGSSRLRSGQTSLGACPRAPPVAPLSNPLPPSVQKLAGLLQDSLGGTFTASGAAAMSVKLAYHGGPGQRSDILDASWGSTVSGGAPNADTVYAIGSVSKLFTDIQLLQAQADGLVNERDTVQASHPDLTLNPAPAYLGGPASGDITWAQLGTHTAGLPRESPCPAGACNLTTSAILQAMMEQEWGLATPPGTAVSYSNAGFALLGRGLEKITGVTWEDHVASRIAAPLGMTHTTTAHPGAPTGNFAWGKDGSGQLWPPQNLGWEAPAGGVYSTTEDLTKLAGAILTSDAALLPPSVAGHWMRQRDRVNPATAANVAPGSGTAYFTAWGMPWEVYTSSPLASNTTFGAWPYSMGTLEFPTKDGEVNGYDSFFIIQPELRLSFTMLMAWGPNKNSDVFGLHAALAGTLAAPPIIFYARASSYVETSGVPAGEVGMLADYQGVYSTGIPAFGNITVYTSGDGVLKGLLPPIMTGLPTTQEALLMWKETDAYAAAPPPGQGCFPGQGGSSYTLRFARNATSGAVPAAALVGTGYTPQGLLVFLRE